MRASERKEMQGMIPSSPTGEGDGVVAYGEAFTVQPFGNVLQTMTLAGAQILADCGDGFVELRNGTNRTGGDVDLDAFADYLAAHPNTAPPATNRITSIA